MKQLTARQWKEELWNDNGNQSMHAILNELVEAEIREEYMAEKIRKVLTLCSSS